MMDAWHFEGEPETTARSEPELEWPEPVDILADPELTGIAPVDETCLPSSILALARAEGERLAVDPCHIASLAISACSAVISDHWRVRLKVKDKGWIERPAVWVAVVAPSGRRKTDCFRAATRGVAKIEARLRETHRRDLARHLEERQAWEALPKAERGPAPVEPVEPRLATDDFTVEALGDLLQTSNKVLLRSDELATMLGAYERYSKSGAINAGRAHALALYDGGPRRVDRTQRGKIYVENWSAVAVGHIQPAKVRDLVNGLSDDGLLQRFMIVMPPPVLTADPDDDDVATDWSAIDQFSAIVEIMHAMEPPQVQAGDGRVESGIVGATGEAHPIRRRLFRLVERIEADLFLPAPLKEAVSKWRGLLARTALTFHVVELAEAKRSGRTPDPAEQLTLKASAVEKACRFIMRVVVPSTFRFHTEIGSAGVLETHARWVAGYLLSRNLTKITGRDVGRAYRELRGKSVEILAVMDLLDHAGWVIPDPSRPKGGSWLVNPGIYDTFKVQADAEKARREANRQKLQQSIAATLRAQCPT